MKTLTFFLLLFFSSHSFGDVAKYIPSTHRCLLGSYYGLNPSWISENLRFANGECADLRTFNLNEKLYLEPTLLGANVGTNNIKNLEIYGAKASGMVFVSAIVNDSTFYAADLDYANFAKGTFTNSRFIKSNLFHVEGNGAQFQKTDFHQSVLAEANFTQATFNQCDFVDADLGNRSRPVAFFQAHLTGNKFDRSNLSGAKFVGGTFDRNSFRETNLTGAEIQISTVNFGDFSQATLTNASLSFSTAGVIVFTQAKLDHAKIRMSQVKVSANFDRASGIGTEFTQMTCSDCNFNYFNGQAAIFNQIKIPGASFKYARLQNSQFQEADLKGASFIYADLTGANLTNAVLTGAKYNDRTKLPFSEAVARQRGMIKVN